MAALTEDVVLSRSRAKSLTSVKKLNCWGTGVSDISILRRMPNVEIVTLSVNEICSLKDFAYCSKLKELYLRRNNVESLEEVQFLKNLPELRVLWLADNPCSESENYRSTILKNLPHIEKLDNIEVISDEIDEAPLSGKEYSVPEDIPVYTVSNINAQPMGEEKRVPELNGNVDTGTDVFQNNSLPPNELLDETNKLRNQLGLKPLIIDKAPTKDENITTKEPVPSTENGLLTTNTKSSNILSAVLLLLNDLDEDDLRVVQKDIVRKLEMIDDEDTELEQDKEVEVLT